MKILTAHQPNLCPYGGMLEKIEQADICVLLGYVQFNYQLYQNRFRADSNWFTMSVVREHGFQLIRQKKYLNPDRDWSVIKRLWPKLDIFDQHVSTNLWAMNTGIIEQSMKIFNIKTELVSDYETHLKSTDRLIDLCKTFGADRYLSGPSGKRYLNEEAFDMAGIQLKFHEVTDKRPLVDMI